MFKRISENSLSELDKRRATPTKLLKFGLTYLDHALRGIFPDDLILIGAPSGMGKTALSCNIAVANMDMGRKVHFIALEASEYEIERRLKYPIVMEKYWADEGRPNLGKISYVDWLTGKYINELIEYETQAIAEFEQKYKNLFVFNKTDKFGLIQLIESVCYASTETDLIIIDHVHYFDFDDDNENRAIKEIAKTVRSLVLEQQKPIILVAHLRKKDRGSDELIAGMEEFHGSSDLFKIATRVITMSPGNPTDDGLFETFFRIPKDRLGGDVARYSARTFFNPKTGGYENDRYEIGFANQSRRNGFQVVENRFYPEWGHARGSSSSRYISPSKSSWFSKDTDRNTNDV